MGDKADRLDIGLTGCKWAEQLSERIYNIHYTGTRIQEDRIDRRNTGFRGKGETERD